MAASDASSAARTRLPAFTRRWCAQPDLAGDADAVGHPAVPGLGDHLLAVPVPGSGVDERDAAVDDRADRGDCLGPVGAAPDFPDSPAA
jgi:hypothetical protein